jgi:glycosidase
MRIRSIYLLALAFIFTSTLGLTQAFVDRIDPPHWWVGMPVDTVQIMVHGSRIAELQPIIDYPGVELSRTARRGVSENYQFLYLHISPDAPAGTLSIEWLNASTERKETLGSIPFELKQREGQSGSITQGYSPADAICLITPDRFANGDSSNDEVEGMLERADRSNDQGRHGGDLAGIELHLGYLDSMGFTAVWLNPVLENNQPQWSYHGYATTDYYRVDPRFGTNAEYKELAQAIRDRGMKLIMDMIMNHCGSEHPWMRDLPTSDWINNGAEFTPTTHRRTTLRDPYASQSDVKGFSDGWFVKEMPDLNHRQPLLADYLIQNTIWWIEFLGLGGIRMDTYPYSDAAFMTRWSCEVMAAYPNFNMCGEEWSLSPSTLSYWQAGAKNEDGYASCLPGLLDFPLHNAFIQCMNEQEIWHSNWVRLYEMLGNDYLYAEPADHVIFPDNHDMSRIHTQLGDDINKTRIALYFFATMRGTPQFYYGTEILMSNAGDDSHGNIRSDFPGGWHGDEVNGFSGQELSKESRAFQNEMRQLLQWRKTASAIHIGRLMHFVPEDGTYVYFRFDESQTFMVVLNQSNDSEALDLARFEEVLNGRRSLRNALTGEVIHAGQGDFSVPAWAALVLEVD